MVSLAARNRSRSRWTGRPPSRTVTVRTGGTLPPPGGRWKLNRVDPAATLRAGKRV